MQELLHIGPIHTVPATGSLRILGQALIEPEREVGNRGVEVAVRHFMAEILRHTVAPLGKDSQPRIGFEEKRAAVRKVGMVKLQVLVELLAILEQVDLDRLPGNGEIQQPFQVAATGSQFVE
jgi:hypothetical protein